MFRAGAGGLRDPPDNLFILSRQRLGTGIAENSIFPGFAVRELEEVGRCLLGKSDSRISGRGWGRSYKIGGACPKCPGFILRA